MTQYSSLNVKLSNSQLNKLKSTIKNETDVVLRLSESRRAGEGTARVGSGSKKSSFKKSFDSTTPFNNL